MNRAIKISKNKYYVVIGSDDLFDNNAIKNYRKIISKEQPDIIASKWIVDKKIISPKKFLVGFMECLVSQAVIRLQH